VLPQTVEVTMKPDLPPCRLRQWRAETGLTLDEVADLTGFHKSFLSRVERGERDLSPMAKVHVARRLGVRISDLFEVEEIPA
jgi:transcriptional regulator with XRE-family HTH domain